ncbi:MAG: hypothetical protein LBM77_12075 [Spirochaetaceae bacterium]|jgi:hypothetical protein|nr:hypothetical protein [Spirochaetaceae bacterium]
MMNKKAALLISVSIFALIALLSSCDNAVIAELWGASIIDDSDRYRYEYSAITAHTNDNDAVHQIHIPTVLYKKEVNKDEVRLSDLTSTGMLESLGFELFKVAICVGGESNFTTYYFPKTTKGGGFQYSSPSVLNREFSMGYHDAQINTIYTLHISEALSDIDDPDFQSCFQNIGEKDWFRIIKLPRSFVVEKL